MKKKEILTIDNFIGSLKLNHFNNETRTAIVANHLRMYKVKDEFEKDLDELKRTLLKNHDEELEKLVEIRKNNNEESALKLAQEQCPELLRIEAELTATANSMLEDDYDISLKKLDLDDFIAGCMAQELSLTPNDLLYLTPLFN